MAEQNPPVRLGFIGMGNIARHHLKNLTSVPEAKIVAVTEPSEEMVQRAKEAYPDLLEGARFFNDYKEMLAEVPMDAVEITTPHTQHYQQIKDCLNKGLNVLTEKPMVCQIDHALELIDLSEKTGKLLMVSYQRHLQPVYRYMRQAVQNGDLGEVAYISGLLAQSWKKGTAGKWRQVPELSGGGQLMDSGSHLIDIMFWITGLSVAEVYAEIDNRGTPVDINSSLDLYFSNGAMGNLSIIGDSPFRMMWEDITISGTEGALYLRNKDLYQSKAGSPDISLVQVDEMASTPDRNFIDTILGKAKTEVPASCGLRVVELSQAAYESAKLGRAVKIEEFLKGNK